LTARRGLITLLLTATCLLALACLAAGGAEGGKLNEQVALPAEPRTYFLWERRLNASTVDLLGLELGESDLRAIFLLNGTGTWRLVALSGADGTFLAASPERKGIAKEVAASSGRLLVVANGSLTALNASLSIVWERIWPGEEVELLGFLSESLAFLRVGNAFICLSLEKPEVAWAYEPGPADVLRACLLPGGPLLVLRRWGGNWSACLIEPSGDVLPGQELDWLSWATDAQLTAYNSTCCLLLAENASHRALHMLKPDGMRALWSLRLHPRPAHLGGPFLMPDLDGDGAPEILLQAGASLRLLSGATGLALCEGSYEATVRSIIPLGKAFFTALDMDGVLRMGAARPESGNFTWFWALAGVRHACCLKDLDGDGLPELLAAIGRSAACIWGSSDDQAPLIGHLWPEDGLSTSIPEVVFMAEVKDGQSGLKSVRFVVDGVAHEGALDPTTGLYVVKARLSPGRHEWHVEAEDRTGHVSRSEERHLAVNLSFFGAPDWLDDVAFFVPWAIALAGASALLVREMHKRGGARGKLLPGELNRRP